MGTPRPTIQVDDLDVDSRPWPKGKNMDYDEGYSKYCFRIGKAERVLWKWPWPEWIGIPNRENITLWLNLIGYWRMANTGLYDNDHVTKCINNLMKCL